MEKFCSTCNLNWPSSFWMCSVDAWIFSAKSLSSPRSLCISALPSALMIFSSWLTSSKLAFASALGKITLSRLSKR